MASRKRRKLPSGWEQRRDNYSNKTYYIDHNTQTTHWTPPIPSHALPPSPSPSPSHTFIPRRKGVRRRHRRSSTLDDVISSNTIHAPEPSFFRAPSKSVTELSHKPIIKRAKTKMKPKAPPLNHRKRAPTNRRLKSHRPRAPPPSYKHTIHNIPPVPPPRSLPNTPNHSTPMYPHSRQNETPNDRTRLHPLQRSSSFGDIPPPPPAIPPPPPRLEDDSDESDIAIQKEEAMHWMYDHSQSENVFCLKTIECSTSASASSGTHLSIDVERSSYPKRRHVNASTPKGDTTGNKKKTKRSKLTRSPTFSACMMDKMMDYTKYKANNTSKKRSTWNDKKLKLKESIKKSIRKNQIDYMNEIDIEEDEIDPNTIEDIMTSIASDCEEEDKKDPEYYTLSEIVERVTSPSVRGTQDQSVLLYTYSLYTTQKELLHVILDRLAFAWNTDNNQIQIKALSLLKQWLKTENDFGEDEEAEVVQNIALIPSVTPTLPAAEESHSLYAYDMPQLLKRERSVDPPFAEYFKKELISATRDKALLQRLSLPILSQLSPLHARARTLSFADAPSSIIPRAKSAMDLELIALNPTEVARQICLAEYDIFKRIKFCEFLQQKTRKKEAKMMHCFMENVEHNLSEEQLQKQAKLKSNVALVNIDAMTDWFNRLVVWTQVEILYQRDDSLRCRTVCCLLNICGKLEEYNNISSLCAIRAGLCSAPIHRLSKTWRSISKKHRQIKQSIDRLFKLGNGQKKLRDRVAIISQPAIPHLGLFVADIMFIHDGNHTFDTQNKINWTKMKLLHDRIHWIYMFQQAPFIFLPVPVIKEYLKSKMKILNEDFLYRLSREVEPPAVK
eukprot:362887_1